MRSQFASLRVLTLPFGAITGTRIVIDGIAGNIQFYNAANQLIGFLSPERWYTGLEDGAHAQLDPFGGLRIFDANGLLAVVLDAASGLQIRDPVTGLLMSSLGTTGLNIEDPSVAGLDIEITNGAAGNVVAPRAKISKATLPGTTNDTPAVTQYTTNDLELRHVACWTNGDIANQTMTVPAGYTEVLDAFLSGSSAALHTCLASRSPAVPNAIRTFTSTFGLYQFDTGITAVIRGAVGLAPSIRAFTSGFVTSAALSTVLTMTSPAGLAVGDLILAFVAAGNDGGSFPSSWSVPDGYIGPIAGDFSTAGSGSGASTLATGLWWKVATADDVAMTSRDVTVNMGGVATKRYHWTVVAVQNPGQIGTGPDIRIGGKSVARGLLLPRFESIGNDGPHGTAITDMNVTVPMIAGRCYHIHARSYIEHTNSTPTFFQWRAAVDGTDVGLIDHFAILNANDLQHLIGRGGPVPYYPITSGNKVVDVRVTRIAGASAVTLVGGATFPRRLEVHDMGGDY
jgi:hypothetical protein